MTPIDPLEELRIILEAETGAIPSEIHPETTIKSLDLDDLDETLVMIAIEDDFDIEIEEYEFHACVTIGHLVELIKRKGGDGE